MPQDPLNSFHPLIRKWFSERFGNPTDVQLRAWTEIIGKNHVLVTAPTGSGKTLASFLWAINQLVTEAWPRGETRVLYISPLKALNNDVRRNLLTPLQEIENIFQRNGRQFPSISVQTRSGDTPGSDRQRMLRHPPEILITTPESLNILLTSKNSRHMLTGLTTVIMDEIHAVAGSKRGTHLITAVERLIPLCGEFQRIALSATVKPLEMVADFVGGYRLRGEHYEKRPVTVVRSDQTKRFLVEIRAPEEERHNTDDEFWPRLVTELKSVIAAHNSTLIFANSRRTTERVTRLINENEEQEIAYAHHGSLSKEIRLAVEEKLERGELKAIVATNTLELGIDIGKLDSVILIQSPSSISSAIQRIGRSGHGVGEMSRGLLFPTHGMDFVEAAVIARAIADGDMEALRPIEAPLDILVQIILSMALTEVWELDDLYAFLKTTYPYRNLPRKHYDLLIGMLEGKYADAHVYELRPRATVDRITNTISTKEGMATLVYIEGGTIPDRGYYDLRIKESGAKIGELDEEFVWERRIGDTFSLGAQVWQIREITHNSVEVSPARKPQQIIPFWRAEEIDRGFYFSEKIASFLEECNKALDHGLSLDPLTGLHAMDEKAGTALQAFLQTQRKETNAPLPHRHHLLIEHYHDPMAGAETEQIILHTLWGNSINRPITFALSAAWEKKFGYPLQFFYNNDGIALLFPHEFDVGQIFSLVKAENIEALLQASLENTGYFGARFRENAGRALLLSKSSYKRRMPLWLNRLRSRKLLGSVLKYSDFPILIETWRTCLQDDFDLATAKSLLYELQEGEISVTEAWTTTPSPFAKGLVWRQTNKYMYEDDTPEWKRPSRLGRDLIQELVYSPHLRPRLPWDLVNLFNGKIQRTAEDYSPDSGRDLIDWVKERLLIPADEWERLLNAMTQDHCIPREDILTDVAERIAWVSVQGTEHPHIAAIEMLYEIASGLGRDMAELSLTPLIDEVTVHEALNAWLERISKGHAAVEARTIEEEEPASVRFLSQWLSFYGPISITKVEETLGMRKELFDGALRSLEETGQLLLDRFSEGCVATEVCDAANLESLLRIFRRSRQPAFEALELCFLPLFLATFQGICDKGETIEDLQKRLDQLFGYPLNANVWEEEIFPARMEGYYTAWLDSLMQTSELLWFGCGPRKISFAFPEDLRLFRNDQEKAPTAATHAELLSRLFPDPQGRYSFPAIRTFSRLHAEVVVEELWKLTWGGIITNDSFVTLRRGLSDKFVYNASEEQRGRRLSVNRWKSGDRGGNWYVLAEGDPPTDPLAAEEMNKDRARVLFDRYGILFRELLQREQLPLQWPKLFRTLRLMELSGEILSGHFFEGIPGLQFISHEAYRMLTRGLPNGGIYWISAVDPASLCGTGLENIRLDLPPRIATTHLVYHGTRLVLVSKRQGRELTIKVGHEDANIQQYFSFFTVLLSRDSNPRKSINVEHINGQTAAESAYRQALQALGFQESYKGLELWRRY